MAEYIDRNELVKNLDRFAPEQFTPLIRQLIEKQPTADVEEVVRCENCKHGSYFEPYNKYICKKIISNPMFKGDFFCADGERK